MQVINHIHTHAMKLLMIKIGTNVNFDWLKHSVTVLTFLSLEKKSCQQISFYYIDVCARHKPNNMIVAVFFF